jgi:hypothetical protein
MSNSTIKPMVRNAGFYFFLGIGTRLSIIAALSRNGDSLGRIEYADHYSSRVVGTGALSYHQLNVEVATRVVPQIVELARKSEYLGIQIAGDKLAYEVAEAEYTDEVYSILLRFAARIELHENEVTNGQRDVDGNYAHSNPFN